MIFPGLEYIFNMLKVLNDCWGNSDKKVFVRETIEDKKYLNR